jgi:hypothetical protein
MFILMYYHLVNICGKYSLLFHYFKINSRCYDLMLNKLNIYFNQIIMNTTTTTTNNNNNKWINVREYRRGNKKWTIQRNWQHTCMVHKTKKNKTKTQYNMRWTPLSETNTNNVNKTWALLQTTGGKDVPNIIFMRKS